MVKRSTAIVRTVFPVNRKVQAKTFIFAAGGLENPRLMLNSTDVHSEGLGNKDDNVGRYFMEHPHLYAEGRFFESPALPARKLYTRRKARGQYVRGYFRVRGGRKKRSARSINVHW